MTFPNIGPFQNIVNVGWGNPRILALILDVTVSAQREGAPPVIGYDFNISVGGESGEILRHKLVKNRDGVGGAPPVISQIVSPAMLGHYSIWAYEPYELAGTIEHSSGGNFYYITPENTGVFPDFVPSPYASVLAAETYLDEQAIIHPEYAGKTFTISFFPPFDTYSQTKVFRQLTFINLGAFPKDVNGNIQIAFTGAGATGTNTDLQLAAELHRGNFLAMLATDTNVPAFGQAPAAFFEYEAEDDDAADIAGTIVVHPEDPPSVTGPDSPGGGGEG